MIFRYLIFLLLISCSSGPEFISPPTHLKRTFPVRNKEEAKSLMQSRMNYLAEVVSQYGSALCRDILKPGHVTEENGNLRGVSTTFLDAEGHEFCPDETHKLGWIFYYYCKNDKVVHELKYQFARPQMKIKIPCP